MCVAIIFEGADEGAESEDSESLRVGLLRVGPSGAPAPLGLGDSPHDNPRFKKPTNNRNHGATPHTLHNRYAGQASNRRCNTQTRYRVSERNRKRWSEHRPAAKIHLLSFGGPKDKPTAAVVRNESGNLRDDSGRFCAAMRLQIRRQIARRELPMTR